MDHFYNDKLSSMNIPRLLKERQYIVHLYELYIMSPIIKMEEHKT
jgi:hypothetical protein